MLVWCGVVWCGVVGGGSCWPAWVGLANIGVGKVSVIYVLLFIFMKE